MEKYYLLLKIISLILIKKEKELKTPEDKFIKLLL